MKLIENGVFLTPEGELAAEHGDAAEARKHTMAYQVLSAHNHSGDMEHLELKFDALVSPDNNYVSILQTARASGLKKFPVPYVLSNCHHTLCAVGGTINQDDHVFGMGNVQKYGGIFLPPYAAVLHQYMREQMAGGGKMILGSDSHTRYGALGTMGIGEGGGEVAKQLLGKTYDIAIPPVVAVHLTGKPADGIGPMDVALTIIGQVFSKGFTKNKILEFVGDGIASLSAEFRMGIDVMMTESGALSSIWATDETIRDYLKLHGREQDYREMKPSGTAYYDSLIELDLSEVECMMALPFHPSNTVSIREFKANPEFYLKKVEEEGNRIKKHPDKPFMIMDHLKNGEFVVDQALIGGCAGGMYENLCAAADILESGEFKSANTGNDAETGVGRSGQMENCDCQSAAGVAGADGGDCGQSLAYGEGPGLGVNPSSLPVCEGLAKSGVLSRLILNGASIRPCICGGCFGVTDVPANNQISIRHMTRNYPNREGSKPGQEQMAASILMDARSIAATVKNHGRLTAATELDVEYHDIPYQYDPQIYEKWVVNKFGQANPSETLKMGPNIADWPEMHGLEKHLLLKVAGAYHGSVTTDDLIPSGDASSFRSNPYKISDYALISYDPGYVNRSKTVRTLQEQCRSGENISDETVQAMVAGLCETLGCHPADITIGSLISSDTIGDGSSREQAASSQKVLGGYADLAHTYATKRYRSNLINWGILPLQTEEEFSLQMGDLLFIKDVQEQILSENGNVEVQILRGGASENREGSAADSIDAEGCSSQILHCSIGALTEVEKEILISGSLINYYRKQS